MQVDLAKDLELILYSMLVKKELIIHIVYNYFKVKIKIELYSLNSMVFPNNKGSNEQNQDNIDSGTEIDNSDNNLIGLVFCNTNNSSYYEITLIKSTCIVKVVKYDFLTSNTLGVAIDYDKALVM